MHKTDGTEAAHEFVFAPTKFEPKSIAELLDASLTLVPKNRVSFLRLRKSFAGFPACRQVYVLRHSDRENYGIPTRKLSEPVAAR